MIIDRWPVHFCAYQKNKMSLLSGTQFWSQKCQNLFAEGRGAVSGYHRYSDDGTEAAVVLGPTH